MSNNISDFSNVLKEIIKNSGGKDSLRDKRKTRNLLSDLAPGDKFQKEKKLLDDAYSCNAVGILLDADSSADRHQKAVEAAKAKLVDNMSLSEKGAESILKDICDALGWNTSQLFGNNSVQQQSAVSQNRPAFEASTANTVVSEVEQYRQAYIQPYNLPSPVNQSTAVNTQSASQTIPVVPEQKKKSKVGTVLKVIGVLLVISVIYNAITGNTGDDSIVEDIQDTQVVTETDKPSAENNNLEAGGFISAVESETSTTIEAEVLPDLNEDGNISPDGLAANAAESQDTVAPVVTTEATTTADPSAGKYVVTDIAKLGYNAVDYQPKFMTYDSTTDMIYYISSSCDIHEYKLSDKSDNIILSGDEIDIALGAFENENSLVQNDVRYSDVSVIGLTYNNYNKQVYLYGNGLKWKSTYSKETYCWIYEIKSGKYLWFQTPYNIGLNVLCFFSDDEFATLNNARGYGSISFTTEDSEYLSGAYPFGYDHMYFDYLLDVNDNYYAFIDDSFYNGVAFYKMGNVYNPEYEKICQFDDNLYGANVKDNKLYYKDKYNNILEIDVNDLTKNEYISIDQIYQTGKSFLGENQCTGLYITNDGGFITYDSSDGKIKYVSMN